jgi:hypothetical protein
MSFLQRHRRSLCLLALLQVLVGPTVLGLLLLAGGLAEGDDVLERRVVAALVRLEVAGLPVAAADEGDLPVEPRPLPGVPVKAKKDLSWTLAELTPLRVHPPLAVTLGHAGRHDPPPSHLGQAPPLPPPRLS